MREEPDGAGDERQRCRREPHPVEVIVVEQDVAEERAEREAAVHRDRPVADGLTAPFLGCEVGDHRGGADEERGFADAGEHSHHDERDERGREHVQQARRADDDPAEDDEDAPPDAVADPPRERTQEHRPDGERADRHADRDVVSAELVLDEQRHDRQEYAERHEVAEA